MIDRQASIQLVHVRSMYLDLIHRYKNQKSFELRRRIIQMLISSDAFTLFLLLVEYRYSYQIPCGPPDPLVDYDLTDLAYLKNPRVLPVIRIDFGESHPLFLTSVRYFRRCTPYF